MLTKRPYQLNAEHATQQFILSGTGNAIIAAECSAGKSLLIAWAAEFIHSRGQRPLILADRAKLIQQNAGKLSAEYGIVSAGLKQYDYKAPIVVAGIQTVYNKAAELGNIDWILIDECESLGNNFELNTRYHQLLKAYPNARIIGWSATPYSLAEGAISWGNIIHEVTYQQLLDGNYCTKITNKICDKPDLASVGLIAKDYNDADLERVMGGNALIDKTARKIVNSLRKYNRKKTLIYCVSINHAFEVGRTLHLLGLKVDVVHGSQTQEQRERRYNDFEYGHLDCLINVDLLTKGVDMPCVDCIVCLRPTKSMRLWFQILGRGIRLFAGKDFCLLLDFSGNLEEFGTLGNPIWKYFGAKLLKKTANCQRICPQCEESVNIGQASCPCGYVFLIADKGESEHSDTPDEYTDMEKPKDPKRWYSPNMVLYSAHVAKSGNKSLRVLYKCGRAEFSEYVQIENKTWFAQKGVKDFCQLRDIAVPANIEAALSECANWKKPKSIQVEPQKANMKYFNIVGYAW